ncbi:NADH-flavin reductase [Actinocatenispora thailandica]|uniref:NADH-flavin reductase n=1 Tax=Actinocatenispora thailandica TaxID=227318 RepID=A0A7R7DTI3_9ACTN|nr:NAD(P)H-binding protein [Actinocatenispora thailandica]BCJ37560.1 NADH-flavin reductase [Actinocatenispora thailandica]
MVTMRLCVFGANGPTGRLVTGQALGEGHHVTAFTRHPDEFPIEHPRLVVAAGDVADQDAVTDAVAGQDAVLSVLGVPYSKDPITVYSVGAEHVTAAMHRTGVERLVAVTSSAVEPNPNRIGGFLFERVLQPYVVNRLGKTLYDDMRRCEAIIRASGLDWTLVRPSGLFAAAEVSRYSVVPGHGVGRFTARIDLADCLLRELGENGHHRQAVAVLTTEGSPSLASMMWREAVGSKH